MKQKKSKLKWECAGQFCPTFHPEQFWSLFRQPLTVEQKIDIFRQLQEWRIRGTSQKMSDKKIQNQMALARSYLEETHRVQKVSK